MIYGHIYVFRHGQTYDNKNKVFSGWRDSILTRDGEFQANLLAKKLKSKDIAFGFSSRLSRMKDTMRKVLKFHPKSKFVIDDRIIERCYGNLQGRNHAVLIREKGQAYFDKFHRGYSVRPPRGESIKMVESRVRPFCKELEAFVKSHKCNVAVVCGNNSMRALRRYFEKLSVAEMMKLENKYEEYRDYTVKT